MISYIYQLKDNLGRNIYGLTEANDKKEVKVKLRESGFYFVSAKPYNKKKLDNIRFKPKELILFTQRLSSLIAAGIPMLSVMTILWRQSEDKNIQLVISCIKNKLAEGNKISDSIKLFPKIFPPIYHSLISVGETSGTLVLVLDKLLSYLEFKFNLKTKIKKATLYPLAVIVFSFVVLYAMYAYVVPTFQRVLFKMKVELPMLTRIILKMSEFARSPVFVLISLVTLISMVFIFRYLRKNKNTAYYLDAFIIKLPAVGPLFMAFSLSQFIRSLSILLGTGVGALLSLDKANSTINNHKLRKEIGAIKKDVEVGVPMYEAFKKVREFPVMLVEMIGVGESSGTMVALLEKTADTFDNEIDYQLNKILTLLEPALIIFVGFVVFITLLAIYLPMISLWQNIR